MTLTDARRMWKLADERGREGLHSHDARRLGISGNPSQRAKDIADHVAFWTIRESRNGRPGSRYFTDGNQPTDATAVRPNRADAELGGEGDSPSPPAHAADLSIEAAPEQVKEPVATVRDWDGVWRELPWDEERQRVREAA